LKLVRREILIDAGEFTSIPAWTRIEQNILDAINSVHWPSGSDKFIIFDEKGKERGKGSGVVPIKQAFCQTLQRMGWSLETKLSIAAREKPGPIDATLPVEEKFQPRLFAVEWETGNISSSHRALNKMALGIQEGILAGGALILPTRNLYQYLTDRVGNLEELEPYFPLWKALPCQYGVLVVYAVEHDGVSKSVPRIPKGTNGRALI